MHLKTQGTLETDICHSEYCRLKDPHAPLLRLVILQVIANRCFIFNDLLQWRFVLTLKMTSRLFCDTLWLALDPPLYSWVKKGKYRVGKRGITRIIKSQSLLASRKSDVNDFSESSFLTRFQLDIVQKDTGCPSQTMHNNPKIVWKTLDCMDHLPYGLDLSPCDFHIFGPLKEALFHINDCYGTYLADSRWTKLYWRKVSKSLK